MIDLRSDTVTQPCDKMRAAMAAAPVGDDVFADDPTVNLLQTTVARRLGFEAGLCVPSGTQSNLVALLTHCQRGDEYLVGETAHTYRYEGGGAAVLGSIQPQPVRLLDNFELDLAQVSAEIKPDDSHFARTRLLCLENTVDGAALSPEYHALAAEIAEDHGLGLHLDGARIWNAAVALGVDVAVMTEPFDTVSLCLSKGLGAPVGSLLLGEAEFISEAHKWRKMLGGGMRQAGVIAAGGLYAFENNIDRLADDHSNAESLAHGLNELNGVDADWTGTNMVFVSFETPVHDCAAKLLDAGVNTLFSPTGGRLVTHLDVSAADMDVAVQAIAALLE